MLASLEEQFYKIRRECERRKISTQHDRVLLGGIMVALPLLTGGFLRMQPQVLLFYRETLTGQLLMTLFAFCYAAGVGISLRVSRFKD